MTRLGKAFRPSGLAVLFASVYPAAALAWIVELGPTSAVTVGPSGDVFVAGVPYFSVARLDAAAGATTWQATLLGTGTGTQEAATLVLDAAGDVVAVGRLANAGTGDDFAIAKLDGTTGAELWRSSLDGTGPSGGIDRGVDLAIDAAGDVLAVGALDEPGGNGFTVAKVDGTTGVEVWRTSLASAFDARAIAVDASGDVFAVGRSEVGTEDVLFVVKLDGALGSELWRVELDPGLHGRGNDVAVDTAGDVVVAGQTELPFTGFKWLEVLKLDGALGTELWRHRIFPIGQAYALRLDGNDDVVVAGSAGELVGILGARPNVLKLDGASGTLVWRVTLERLGRLTDVGLNAAGDAFASGVIHDDLTNDDILLLRIDGTTGAEEWRHVQDGTEPAKEFFMSTDRLNAVGVGAAGDVAAVGRRDDVSGLVSFAMKVDEDDGSAIGFEGSKLLVKDPGDPSKRSIKLVLKDDRIQAPGVDSAHDPRTAGGSVRIWNPATLEEAVFPLPAGARWKALGTPAGSKGFRYRDKTGFGPCMRVVVNPGKKIVAACKAKNGSIPFTLDEPTHGSLAVSVRLGFEAPQCATFGGLVIRDEPGQFKAKSSPQTSSCP